MKNKYITILTITCLLLSTSLTGKETKQEKWDQTIIKEEKEWSKLLKDYEKADYDKYWAENEKMLKELSKEKNKSQWADDAILLMAGYIASIDNDFEGALALLDELILNDNNGKTVVVNWFKPTGCVLNEFWVEQVSGLANRDKKNNERISTIGYESDGYLDHFEREALFYFSHLETYPEKTKTVAQYIQSLILVETGDIKTSISILEDIIRNSNMNAIRNIDHNAAKNKDGFLIYRQYPNESLPLWRVEYKACFTLIELYQKLGENQKAIDLAKKFVDECSYDGWYWNANITLASILKANNQFDEAALQYELVIDEFNRVIELEATRMEQLDLTGNFLRPEDFTNYKDFAAKRHEEFIQNVRQLSNQTK